MFAVAVIKFQRSHSWLLCQHNLYRTRTSSSELITICDYICSILPVYAGSRTSYFDLSLEPTQELFVTLVTLTKSLCCHLGDHTREIVLLLRWPDTRVLFLIYLRDELHCQLSVRFYMAIYRSRRMYRLVVGPERQGQLSVHFFRASDRFISAWPDIGPDLQGQWSVHVYRASYRFRSTVPILCSIRISKDAEKSFKYLRPG